jgi:hypothetical protein
MTTLFMYYSQPIHYSTLQCVSIRREVATGSAHCTSIYIRFAYTCHKCLPLDELRPRRKKTRNQQIYGLVILTTTFAIDGTELAIKYNPNELFKNEGHGSGRMEKNLYLRDGGLENLF